MRSAIRPHCSGRLTTPIANRRRRPRLNPIQRAQRFGYVTVGESIDPRDWQTPTTAQAILDEVKAEKDNGHIILLHDAGGNRDATVQACRSIIEYFQCEGLQVRPRRAI